MQTLCLMLTQHTKAEFELAMSQALENGIKQGISAENLGRQIRHYLNNPDMMYRRYHLKKAMADGTKRDVVEWRRRVIDEQGKVRFVKEDLAHVGTGVYRSARQNALRLTITGIWPTTMQIVKGGVVSHTCWAFVLER